jgi:ABC-type multidrug transport system fused ATPase/permease subunit
MSQAADVVPTRRRKRGISQFWRACGYLRPYRRLVAVSILCALLTGAFTATGLGAMLPLLSVLVHGTTVKTYVDGVVVERTLKLTLAQEQGSYRVVKRDDAAPPDAPANGTLLDVATLASLADRQSPQTPGWLRAARWGSQRLPDHPVAAIAAIFGVFVVIATLGSVTRFFQEYLSDTCAISAINDIRRKLYDHVLHLPVGYFTRFGTGDLTARLVTDAQGLQDGFKTVLGKAIQEPINAIFALIVAMIIDWRLTLFIIVFAPLMVVVVRKFGTKVRRAMRAALEKNSRMLGQIDATLGGIRVVKSAAAEPHERRRYRAIMDTLKVEQFRMARYEAWSTPTLEMLGLAAVGCVLIFASYLVLVDRSLQAPQFMVIMFALAVIGESLRRVSKLNNVLQRSNAAASRLFEILDQPGEGSGRNEDTHAASRNHAAPSTTRDHAAPSTTRDDAALLTSRDDSTELVEVREGAVGVEVGVGVSTHESPRRRLRPARRASLRFDDAIAFDGVTFTYPGAENPALIDVSLTVAKGTSVAIVGRNGSGKTTLLALLPRFFDPQRGAIRIDGTDVRDWPIRRLRRMIGIVTQEAVLFPGTIHQNIAYARPDTPREAVVAAAKRAYAHDFILEKPFGYDTPLDGLGGQLSGGQRQRINIARAILRDTPILVLDEATSQVDAESEHLIQQAITSLMKDRTTFVIAHRFSTILSADVIVVLDRGRVVGTGRHDELLETCPTYKQLYERQLFAA